VGTPFGILTVMVSSSKSKRNKRLYYFNGKKGRGIWVGMK
jgi:hypothetical protein